MQHPWANLPWELTSRPQWCISGSNKIPLTLWKGRLVNASVTVPESWLSFHDAATYAYNHGMDVGYVLSASDEFTCIDFDIKDAQNAPDAPHTWTTYEEYDRYMRFIHSLDSYTEKSRSGKGFHVWCKGKIGAGVRTKGIEVYSQERFMICTGNLHWKKPIEDRANMVQSIANWVASQRPKRAKGNIPDEPQKHDDYYLYEVAKDAENEDKFNQLWAGHWREMGYPSQSEADLALMSMFTFYSPNNEQCKRLFRLSALGQRDKAQKNDSYLDRTIATVRSREYEEKQGLIKVDLTDFERMIDAKLHTMTAISVEMMIQNMQGLNRPMQIQPLHVPASVPVQPREPHAAATLALAAPVPVEVHAQGKQGLAWPPGAVGRIAQFIYQSSYLPVKEVSIVSALGLMAGLCGKAWHIPLSGLNMYINLIAKSAIGKEAMHSGISALVRAVTEKIPFFSNFVYFDDFASGQALQRACGDNPSFVHVSGEWGRKLKLLAADDGRNASLQSLRTQMTNLYQKSGPSSIVGGIRYSNADSNVRSVSGISYSMIGESTPGTFYESLTESMMEDGFLSRFLNIEYDGPRVEPNRNIIIVPDVALVDLLAQICSMADKVCKGMAPSMPVYADEESQKIMRDFEDECGREINGTQNESYRQMWNRAALKAQRTAGLLAVGNNHIHPCITSQEINWGIDVVRRDIAIMQRRIESGDVGITDHSRQRKLQSVIKRYLNHPLPNYWANDCQHMKDQMVVPRKYLQVHTAQSSAFSKFRGGAVQALNLTIQAMIDNGYLAEIDKVRTAKDFKYSGKLYRILVVTDIPAGDES